MAVWESDGLRVVELGSGISAAFAARLLADFGADVIKVETPGRGDEMRYVGPFPGDKPHPEQSGMFLYLNFNKRGVTLDIETPADAAQLAELLADADVLIENLGPGRLDALPWPAGALSDRLIVCSISPYGQDGPKAEYLASELSVCAAGGLMYISGEAEREPLKQALNQAGHHSGVNAASAVLTASFLQRRDGRGQRIDISQQETMAMTVFPALSTYSYTGGVMRRGRGAVPKLISSMPMPTKDGWIMPSYAGLGTWWESFAAFMELPEGNADALQTPGGRQEQGELIDEMFGAKLKQRTTSDVFHQGQEWGLTLTALQSVADVVDSDHLVQRGFFLNQDHPVAGRVKMPGAVPIVLGIDRQARRPAPLLGEHNDETFGASAASLATNGRESPLSGSRDGASPLPLEGIRVLELGMVIVLPLATAPLAAMGADVVKVESGSRPDQTRWGPQPENVWREDAHNLGGNFQAINRNKRGVTIDLSKPGGRDLLLRLVAVSDVVAENFTSRVLENLGLTYEKLREVNPRIILLSSNGFGHTGPWQNYKSYGPNIEAVDGLMLLTGYADGPPQRAGSGGLGVTYPDVAGANFGAFAVLAALERRERTGEGAWLDLSQYEAGVATIPEAILDYTMNGRMPQRTANRHPSRAPQGVYPCEGLDRWIAVSIATDEQFKALTQTLELPADGRFSTQVGRRDKHGELDSLIAERTASWQPFELERALQAAGVNAAVVQTARDILLDPQLKHRGFFQPAMPPASAPDVGVRPHPRTGWKMSVSPADTRHSAPLFGEHTDEVLMEYLEMGGAEIADLEAAEIIARAPREGMVSREPVDLQASLASGRFVEVDPFYREQLTKQFES